MAKHTAQIETPDLDAPVRAAWGFTADAWHALSNTDRAFYRLNVVRAMTVNAR